MKMKTEEGEGEQKRGRGRRKEQAKIVKTRRRETNQRKSFDLSSLGK